ncbi:MAG: DNA internalization-related competence protein ComEC/Rec2 [Chlorobi bacterium]|nr:DNA internalization-related competence protein ComEC/Rec2 [Chlorobiota bacterium]
MIKDFPLIKFVIYFALGIVLQRLFEFEPFLTLEIFILSAAAILFFLIFKKYYEPVLVSFLSVILLVSFGALYLSVFSMNPVNYPFEKEKIKNAEIFGTIKKIKLPREGRIDLIISADSILAKNEKYYLKSDILCFLKIKSEKRLSKLFNEISIGNYASLKAVIRKGKTMRNPGEFDYQAYLEGKNIVATASAKNAGSLKISDGSKAFFANAVFEVRKSIDGIFRKYYDKRAASLLRGVILADRGEIDYKTKQYFVNAGVIHILAVSGLHVGFIVLIFFLLSGRFNLKLKFAFTIAGIVFFLILTESPPSVFRASIMAIALIIAFWTNRSYNAFNAIAFAGLVILALNPAELFHPGFQLSFSAVLSILIFYPIFSEYINEKITNNLSRKIVLFSAVSIAAQIGTIPFTLFYFKKLSVIALFANLLVIPLIGFIISLGILTIITAFLSVWLTTVYAAANGALIDALFWLVQTAGSWEFSYLDVTRFSTFDSVLFYSLLALFLYFRKMIVNAKAKIVFILLLVGNFFLYAQIDDENLLPENKLSIVSIDIGQGDSFLIKFPNNKIALVDAGNATFGYDAGKMTIEPLLKNFGISKIDYAFVSHLDADHYKGYLSLIKDGFVRKVFKPAIDSSLKKDVKFERLLRRNKIPFSYYHKTFMDIGGTRLYILNDTADAYFENLDTNNKSGIMKLCYGKNAILFTGDLEKRGEVYYVNKYDGFLKSQILKVGHHGSKSSASERFLEAVNPELGIISVGSTNNFGHPSPLIIDRLKNDNVKILRTDKSGALILTFDGDKYTIINWREM